MHARHSELIAIRDHEPVDALIAAHVEHCDECSAELSALARLRQRLVEMQPLRPEVSSWERILAAHAGEQQPRATHAGRWGAVAALLVAATGFLLAQLSPGPTAGVQSGMAIHELQQRSRELEYALQNFRHDDVMTLGTASAIQQLQDSITLIDLELNDAAGDAPAARKLWQRRIALMESLLTVRSAQYYADTI